MVQPVDVEETMKKLNDAGYDDGPACSPAFMLAEGDELEVRFRGNVNSRDTIKRLQEIYNSAVSTSVNFTVDVDNKHLQEKYPMYQGFVQLFKKEKTSVEKSVKDNDGKTRRDTVFEYKRMFLYEVLIQIPKVRSTNMFLAYVRACVRACVCTSDCENNVTVMMLCFTDD